MNAKRILFAGESWATYAVHTKGASAYTTASYEQGADELLAALRSAGHHVDYIPNEDAVESFPYTVEELSSYDVVVLSDIPADSFLLPHAVFVKGERRPNRTHVIDEFVKAGGGLLMIGGYMSFAGFEGRGRWASTRLADTLPVTMSATDDRVEAPQGADPIFLAAHEVLPEFETPMPYFLGYNRVTAKPDSEVLIHVDGDPLLVVGTRGAGRTAAFTSDCSPHWGSPAFMAWPEYGRFWSNLVEWCGSAR